MPKVNAAMRGVFKEMLEDYLLQTAKKGGRGAAREGGQALGREAAQAAGREADKVLKVPFKLTKRMQKYSDEMTRQLERQLKHFDGMTPKQILEGLENPAKRTGKAQKEARERFTKQMAKRQEQVVEKLATSNPSEFAKQLKEFGVTASGNTYDDISALAQARTKGFMDTVAALHEPDIVAGGLDRIGKNGNWDSMGLSNVNSSIGSQWKNLKPDLIDALRKMDPNTPISLGHNL
ncbi:polymorphic toxin type 15 domain-containing protein [Propionibacteriaceae bacterium G57]|uniref:polymorphic toxin type 15 domain-containing protein n=1 Tax=Aestuariimicrobium sp. G57 TaxID=3418485 RepID=UPI003DA71644